MNIKASDSPYDDKQKLLRQVRQQIGRAGYDRLVDRVGEDGLVDLALEQLREASGVGSTKSVEKKKGFWGEWGWLVFWILLAGLGAAAGDWSLAGYLFVM